MNSSGIIAICTAMVAISAMVLYSSNENDKIRAQVMVECLKLAKYDCNMK